MGYVKCPCGNRVSDVAQPNPDQSVIIGAVELEHMDEGPEQDGQLPADWVLEHGEMVWHCRDCGNIAIDQPGGRVKWYAPVKI